MDAKRTLDLALAGPAFLLSLPVQAGIAVAISRNMGRPVIFRQERPGLNGRVFTLYKFRSMKDIDEVAGLVHDDDRITPLGHFLRSTSLDELPTLWNVVKGDMSLVGPRPLLVRYLERYTPEQARRHQVRPGLTGLAQVSGRNAITWEQKFAYDVEYVDRHSLMGDLKIIGRTFAAVLKRDGISAEGIATMPEFLGSTQGVGQSTNEDTRRTRVLHVLSALDVGGTESRTLELQQRLLARNIQFDYLTLSGREGVLADRARSMGSEVIPLALSDARFAFRLLSLLRRRDYDAIDSHVATASGAILIAARMSGTPIRIAHFRSDGDGRPDTFGRRIKRSIGRRLIRHSATAIVGVSPSCLENGYCSTWRNDSKASVIPNGFAFPTTSPPQPLGSDSLHIVIVGRGLPSKRRAFAVEVVAAIRLIGRPAHLSIVGAAGDDSDAISDAIRQNGAEHFVTLVGPLDEVVGAFEQAHASLLPSKREGLPGVVLESLSAGTPVVANDIPGARWIHDNTIGVTLMPEDATAYDWARATIRVADTTQRESIRKAIRQSIFTAAEVDQTHSDLYLGHTKQ